MTMKTLEEGGSAPDFDVPAAGMDRARLGDFRGSKLVLFFYPKADTSGCTQESIEFSDLYEAFASCGAQILGASADSVKKQAKFRDKYGLRFPLLSDETHEMLLSYGVWAEKSMYGRKYMGVERSTFLIGDDGRILKIWRKVKVPQHASEVLQAVRDVVKC